MNALPIKEQITVAICSYNAANYLSSLLEKLIYQACTIQFEILIVDNNSTDNTEFLVKQFANTHNRAIRYVTEAKQGIPYARNRAIEESLNSRYLAFIDADELPEVGWLQAAVDALIDGEVDSVGGRISVALPERPRWLSDDLLAFYGVINHSASPIRITDGSTPIWSGNIAYNTRIFHNGLRFDTRYNRKGKGIGGGEDNVMFNYFLQHNYTLSYAPNMAIQHLIPDEKIKRSYFLKLHFIAGKKSGLYEINPIGKKIAGIPCFMFVQLIKKSYQVLMLGTIKRQYYMREAMNIAYQAGMMIGLYIKRVSALQSVKPRQKAI